MAMERLTVYCINLDETDPRWLKTQERFGALPFVDLVRVPGVPGNTLPRTAATYLAKHSRVDGGVMGCFLANVAAWERVAAGAERALIIEDDVDPFHLERVLTFDIPPGIELLFVNPRMAERPDAAGRLKMLPVRTIIPAKIKVGRLAGTGCDGYMLTPKGAAKLLAAVGRDGFFGHVDWRIVRYSLRRSDVFEDEAAARSWLPKSEQCSDQPERQWDVVRARRLNVPLVSARRGVRSVRKTLGFSGEEARRY